MNMNGGDIMRGGWQKKEREREKEKAKQKERQKEREREKEKASDTKVTGLNRGNIRIKGLSKFFIIKKSNCD